MSQISRDQLEEMFQGITDKTDWDLSGPMLWGYFFTHSDPEALRSASVALERDGYNTVDIYMSDKEGDDDPDLWWLHVEKVEVHTVDSLNDRNNVLTAYAEAKGLMSYDGMDVGPAT